MGVQKLSENEIHSKLEQLKGWSLRQGKLHRTLEFKDFAQAFSFMTRVALAAEAMNHHPEWFNVWNRVTLDLSTHSAGGVSQADFELAGRIEEILRG